MTIIENKDLIKESSSEEASLKLDLEELVENTQAKQKKIGNTWRNNEKKNRSEGQQNVLETYKEIKLI